MSDGEYNFGVRLKIFREKKNLTQEKVGKVLGVTAGTVNKYENNALLPPIDKLEKMAILYHTSLDYLRNLDNRACVYIDDLLPDEQIFIKSVVDSIKMELKILKKNR